MPVRRGETICKAEGNIGNNTRKASNFTPAVHCPWPCRASAPIIAVVMPSWAALRSISRIFVTAPSEAWKAMFSPAASGHAPPGRAVARVRCAGAAGGHDQRHLRRIGARPGRASRQGDRQAEQAPSR